MVNLICTMVIFFTLGVSAARFGIVQDCIDNGFFTTTNHFITCKEYDKYND